MRHLLIFEGPELAGKSWLLGQIYNWLVKKYTTSQHILNGCVWLNTDIGVLGTAAAPAFLAAITRFAGQAKQRHILLEKFHLTDAVYRQQYRQPKIDWLAQEKKLYTLGAKVVFCDWQPTTKLIKQRLQDRLRLYPHYRLIAQTPASYQRQTLIYRQIIKQSSLPVLPVDLTSMPNEQAVNKILLWLKEI